MITVTVQATGVMLEGPELEHEVKLPGMDKPSVVTSRFYGIDKLEAFKIWKDPKMPKPNIKLVWFEGTNSPGKDPLYTRDTEVYQGVEVPEMAGNAEFKYYWTRKMPKPLKWTPAPNPGPARSPELPGDKPEPDMQAKTESKK